MISTADNMAGALRPGTWSLMIARNALVDPQEVACAYLSSAESGLMTEPVISFDQSIWGPMTARRIRSPPFETPECAALLIVRPRFQATQPVRQSIVRTKIALRVIVPPIVDHLPAFGMKRIDDAVLRLVPFADDKQTHLIIRVVEETMHNPRSGGKPNPVAGLQTMKMAIEPYIGFTLDDVHKLLLCALGMREGGAPARRQSLMMNAQFA
ncbi:hypothetical protein A6U88_22620 [Agrobacterium sp. B131/95]|nr:hypothetical protein A6U88_22620 [Agrobacterium sp. B131/95]